MAITMSCPIANVAQITRVSKRTCLVCISRDNARNFGKMMVLLFFLRKQSLMQNSYGHELQNFHTMFF